MDNIQILKEALKNADLYEIEEALKERLQEDFENVFCDGVNNLDSERRRILKFHVLLND